METLIIHMAMTATASVIVFIILLIVAGIIGYVTSWYYAKSVYTPVIKELEREKAELNTQVAGLKMDIGDLKRKVENLNEKTGTLEKELAAKNKEINNLKEAVKKGGTAKKQ